MPTIRTKALILTIFLSFFKALIVDCKSIGTDSTDSTDWQSIASKALENDVLFPNGMNDVEFFNAVPSNSLVWPNGIIYYAIDSSFAYSTLINGILSKMSTNIGLNSTGNYCIRFTPRTTQTNYLNYWAGTGGCSSYVGMIGGRQNVSLGTGCIYNGTIIHETMHGIGFYHEQNREDRDTYLTVNLQNIAATYQYNFRKLTSAQERLYASFDLTSIMIYGNYAFSNNSQKTLVAINGQTLYEAYSKYALTSLNIQAIRGLYNCTYPTNATTTTTSTTTTSTTTSTTTTSTTTKPTTTTSTTTTTTSTTTAAPTTTTKATTTTQSSVFTCTKEGYFANPSNCSIFYRCVAATTTTFTKYQFTCQTGTVFSNSAVTCIAGTTSSCPSRDYEYEDQHENEKSNFR